MTVGVHTEGINRVGEIEVIGDTTMTKAKPLMVGDWSWTVI